MVAIGIFTATLDGSIVNIAVPTIMKDLQVSIAAVQWMVMIYLLVVTSLLLSFGRLNDIYGRCRVYSIGLAAFSVGSCFCGLAPNIYWLIGARFAQGMGASMIMACTPALIVDAFPPAERGRALGVIGSVVASGLTAGPVIGGLLMHFFSWRAIFLINIPIVLTTVALANSKLKGSHADTVRRECFDWQGAIVLAICLGSLLLVITHSYEWGYFSSPILLLTGLFLLNVCTLIAVEKRVVHPILDSEPITISTFVGTQSNQSRIWARERCAKQFSSFFSSLISDEALQVGRRASRGVDTKRAQKVPFRTSSEKSWRGLS